MKNTLRPNNEHNFNFPTFGFFRQVLKALILLAILLLFFLLKNEALHWIHLNFLNTKMLCVKFGWNWFSCSGEGFYLRWRKTWPFISKNVNWPLQKVTVCQIRLKLVIYKTTRRLSRIFRFVTTKRRQNDEREIIPIAFCFTKSTTKYCSSFQHCPLNIHNL